MPAQAYTQDISTGTRGSTPLRWASGAVVRYSFNENFAPGNNNDLVRAALREAFRTWMAAMPLQDGKPVVTFEEAGTTRVNVADCDHINLITFTDTVNPIGTLVAAVGRNFTPAGFTHFVCSGTGEDIFTPVGEIQEFDLVFNPAFTFSTSVQGPNVYDIQAVAVHQIGHALGLAHSGVLGSAMTFSCDFGVACTRRLSSDDVAALRAIYGPPGGPAISGTVTDTSGSPVKSEHVVATDAATGLTTASAMSDQNGKYRLAGLPAGVYRVFAEPLDGPVSLSSFPCFYQDGNNSFVTTFLSNPVIAGPDEVSGIDFRVSTPADTNLQFVGLAVGGRGAGHHRRLFRFLLVHRGPGDHRESGNQSGRGRGRRGFQEHSCGRQHDRHFRH